MLILHHVVNMYIRIFRPRSPENCEFLPFAIWVCPYMVYPFLNPKLIGGGFCIVKDLGVTTIYGQPMLLLILFLLLWVVVDRPAAGPDQCRYTDLCLISPAAVVVLVYPRIGKVFFGMAWHMFFCSADHLCPLVQATFRDAERSAPMPMSGTL